MVINRRGLLGLVPATFALTAAGRRAAAEDAPRFVVADTQSGRLRGEQAAGVCVFRGVPYGGSVAGPMRFRAPPPPARWAGVRDALVSGPRSIQPRHPLGIDQDPATPDFTMAEDCLVLNVWTPAVDGRRRPVMVYSHGGGYAVGGADDPTHDGAHLAREQDVVVVESNHRLGLLGYIFLADLLGADYPGNQGLLDIVAALRWTATNIAAFGGDPANVMIFGESGGGGKTSALYAMPPARDLFNKASIESGPSWAFVSRKEGTATALAALNVLGIPRGEARRLLDVPAAQLLAAQQKVGGIGGPILIGGPDPARAQKKPVDFGPVIDGTILPANPFSPVAPAFSATKPLIVGFTRDERVFQNWHDPSAFMLDEAGLRRRLTAVLGSNAGPALTLYARLLPHATPSQLFLRITRDAYMWSSVVLVAERKAAQHAAPVYVYELAYASPTPVPGTDYPIGSPHSSDIFMKFDNVPPPSTRHWLFEQDQSAGRRQVARTMSTMWGTFARTGHPGAKGVPSWPAYTEAARATMVIDVQCRVEMDPDRDARLFWQALRPNAA